MPLAIALAAAGRQQQATANPQPAQVLGETLVTAPRLTGYWSVIGPNLIQFKVSLTGGIQILYSGQTDVRDICLLAYNGPQISATCSGGPTTGAAGGVAHDKLSLHWSRGPAELIFNGNWDRKTTIEGEFNGGFAGIPITGRIPATLTKITPSSTLPGSATALRHTLDDLRRGGFTNANYEPGAIKRVTRAQTWPGAALPAASIMYLGGIHVHWQRGQPDLPEDVYEVRSGTHLSLCRVGISNHGLVNDFACEEQQ